MKSFWSIAILVLIAIGAGIAIARTYWPKVVQPPPEVRYVDREITKRDTVTIVRPETRTIYRQVEKLVRDTIYVPENFTGVGIISASPIKFERGNIILTYFGLSDSAFVQDRFRIPRPNFGYYIAAITAYDPFDRKPQVGLEAAIRYRAFTLYTRGTTPENFSIGLRVRLRGVE